MTHSTSVARAFAAVPQAVQVDCVELNRIPGLAIEACQRLDLPELERLAARVEAIASRHPTSPRVLALVRRVGHVVRFQQRKAGRMLSGSGLEGL
ncbi:hypothetical protein Dgeo_1361 [Deinococcus geothermalis DSM 11300]|uniref:Uncharacterized protein n=1 Tax=Deinococcus geothermalis (strain DSM 11300 / CIP 105573 / AG-3a) TaxID=319795 RepID=Q1IYM8_DEIGD|nr:hypothetical protein [Deinococcus geothermalis]ABF45656.1 hypothetical protein Dgeo_1361 [Deinococcus geothermalis DSM 11300]